MAASSANILVKCLTFFLVLCLTKIVQSQEYDDVQSEALERNARAIFVIRRPPPPTGYQSLRRQIRGYTYIPPVYKRRVISIMRPDKRPVDKEATQNYDKRGVIFMPPRPRPGQRIGKRFSYDSDEDDLSQNYDKRTIIFYPPGAKPRHRGGRVEKRAVIRIMRPGKRYEPVYDPFFEEYDEVGKRGIISAIRPGRGKRTGYNVVTHGLGKRTGYDVLRHGLGKRDYDSDWVDRAVANGIGKRGVGRVMRLPGKRSIEDDGYGTADYDIGENDDTNEYDDIGEYHDCDEFGNGWMASFHPSSDK